MSQRPIFILLPLTLIAAILGAWLAGGGAVSGWGLLGLSAICGWVVRRELDVESVRRKVALADALKQAAVRDQELDRIRKVADAMVSGDTLDHVLQVIADAVADLLESESSAIGFVVEEGRF